MFDLPARPRHVSRVLPDSSQKTRSPQSHGRDGEDTADNVDSSEDSLRQKNVIRISDHDADDDAFPVVSVSSETKAGLEFESETLDEFPSPNREELDSEDEPDSETSSSFVPEDTSEEEVSISVYMERLLARNRQVTSARTSNSEPRGSEKKPHASGGLSIGASNEAATTKTGNAASVSKPETWFADTPRHRQNRDKVRADVQVLRQVANQSARSAVASASRRDVRKQVIVKTAASTLALGSGVAALLLDVSMLFGLVVLGIGLVFAVDLTLTIFRNWNQRRSLRNSAAAVKGQRKRRRYHFR